MIADIQDVALRRPLERNRFAVGKYQLFGEPASALLCSCFASAVACPNRSSCPRDQFSYQSKPCAAPRLRSRACTRKAATACGEAIVCAGPSGTGFFLEYRLLPCSTPASPSPSRSKSDSETGQNLSALWLPEMLQPHVESERLSRTLTKPGDSLDDGRLAQGD